MRRLTPFQFRKLLSMQEHVSSPADEEGAEVYRFADGSVVCRTIENDGTELLRLWPDEEAFTRHRAVMQSLLSGAAEPERMGAFPFSGYEELQIRIERAEEDLRRHWAIVGKADRQNAGVASVRLRELSRGDPDLSASRDMFDSVALWLGESMKERCGGTWELWQEEDGLLSATIRAANGTEINPWVAVWHWIEEGSGKSLWSIVEAIPTG